MAALPRSGAAKVPCRSFGRRFWRFRLTSRRGLGLLKGFVSSSGAPEAQDPALCRGAKTGLGEASPINAPRRSDRSCRCRGTRVGLREAVNRPLWPSRASPNHRFAPETADSAPSRRRRARSKSTDSLQLTPVAAGPQREHPNTAQDGRRDARRRRRRNFWIHRRSRMHARLPAVRYDFGAAAVCWNNNHGVRGRCA